MRRLLLLIVVTGLPLALACKSPKKGADDGGAEAGAVPSASASDSSSAAAASASTPTATGPHYGPPAAGTPCLASQPLGCSTDHSEELSCSGGVWRVMQACRGPGACKGTGAATTCDVGTPIVGDACVAGNAVARCVRKTSVQQCSGGKWTESVCMPPSSCHPAAGPAPAACK
jgi:hypothetical protein